MTTTQEALRLAEGAMLESLQATNKEESDYADEQMHDALYAIREAAVKESLTTQVQPAEQEPDYYGLTHDHTWLSIGKKQYDKLKPEGRMACYTAPPQRECKDCAAKQAEIDRLMLEFCPDEMTEEQTAEWAKHQKAEQAEKQKPVAFVNWDNLDNMLGDRTATIQKHRSGYRATPLYTAPPQREWVSLTQDYIWKLAADYGDLGWQNCTLNFARAIEAKLKEKNQ